MRRFLDPQQMSRTNQDKRTLDKSSDRLVGPGHKLAKFLTRTSSKVHEPLIYDEILNDPVHRNKWRKIIDEELGNLDLYQIWVYTSLLIRQKAIGCKWIFKVKYYLDGSIQRYKKRLVDQGFSQVHGIDYTKTFVPTIRHESLRIFLAITTLLRMIILQMDIIGT